MLNICSQINLNDSFLKLLLGTMLSGSFEVISIVCSSLLVNTLYVINYIQINVLNGDISQRVFKFALQDLYVLRSQPSKIFLIFLRIDMNKNSRPYESWSVFSTALQLWFSHVVSNQVEECLLFSTCFAGHDILLFS